MVVFFVAVLVVVVVGVPKLQLKPAEVPHVHPGEVVVLVFAVLRDTVVVVTHDTLPEVLLPLLEPKPPPPKLEPVLDSAATKEPVVVSRAFPPETHTNSYSRRTFISSPFVKSKLVSTIHLPTPSPLSRLRAHCSDRRSEPSFAAAPPTRAPAPTPRLFCVLAAHEPPPSGPL